ncbi:hypothetical protein TNIN_86601 [Trichonephila inaurata madagascariensis]|uniref:Uncharacterized protein n=1 Tax=Trichonephila inaurata madagascariensis TaxID=2747483 RepID=A0A8X6Y773_9ARAC|nr:hypothetical protein TNIN_86601 [Trichonephila inaurata madagascariensis]
MYGKRDAESSGWIALAVRITIWFIETCFLFYVMFKEPPDIIRRGICQHRNMLHEGMLRIWQRTTRFSLRTQHRDACLTWCQRQ